MRPAKLDSITLFEVEPKGFMGMEGDVQEGCVSKGVLDRCGGGKL